MKKARVFLAGLLATTMALGSVLSVSAAVPAQSGSLKGTGALEGNVETDIIKVVVPVRNLNFAIDPQGLLVRTGAAKAKLPTGIKPSFKKDGKTVSATDEKTLSSGLVFFTNTVYNTDGKTIKSVEYTNTLNLQLVNKSSCAIKVTPTLITTNKSSDITIAEDDTFSGTEKELYLALKYKDENKADKTLICNKSSAAGAGVGSPVKSDGSPTAYVYKYDRAYKYEFNEAAKVSFKTVDFTLVASCNPGADWATAKTKPALDLTWKFEVWDDSTSIPQNPAP